MLIDKLNTLVGTKPIHIIAYTDNSDFSLLSDYDLVFQYEPTVNLYKKVNNSWVVVTDPVASDLRYQSVDLKQPVEYYGVEVNGQLDNSWPPQIGTGCIYVSNDKSLILNEKVKRGEFVIYQDKTYLIRSLPVTVNYNWVLLGEPKILTGPWWNNSSIAVDIEGVTEIGNALDFHDNRNDGNDFSYRLLNSSNNLWASGNLVINGTLHAKDTTLDSLIVTNNTSTKSLNVSDTTTLNSLSAKSTTLDSVTVTNNSTTNTLTVTNASTLNTLNAKSTTLDSLGVTNNTNTKTLTVTNNSTLNALSAKSTTLDSLSVTNNSTTNTLTVTNNTNIGTLSVANNTQTNSLAVTTSTTTDSLIANNTTLDSLNVTTTAAANALTITTDISTDYLSANKIDVRNDISSTSLTSTNINADTLNVTSITTNELTTYTNINTTNITSTNTLTANTIICTDIEGDGSKLNNIDSTKLINIIPINNLPTGITHEQIAFGDHTHNYESNIFKEINTNYNVVSFEKLLVDTNTSITITLPSTVHFNDQITIVDAYGLADVHNITVNPNGKNIQGNTSNYTISTPNHKINLLYLNSTRGWILI